MKNFTKTNRSFLGLTFFLTLLMPLATDAQVQYEKNLQVKNNGQGLLLSWSTFSEENNASFSIERSLDGAAFQVIGSVQSKLGESNSELNEYQFKDDDLGLKKVHYRLQQISTDGTRSFSETMPFEKRVVMYFKVLEKEKISNDLFRISVESIQEGELKCRFSTKLGDVIYDEIKPLKIGFNDYMFDLSSEPDGEYQVILKLGQNQKTVDLNKETKKKNNVAQSKNPAKRF